MSYTLRDDRTPEQKKTHVCLVIGTDSFMSGWGGAENGLSYAAWACRPEHESQVYRWVSNRSEMKRVRVSYDRNYRPSHRGFVHCHVYVVDEGHPSLV